MLLSRIAPRIRLCGKKCAGLENEASLTGRAAALSGQERGGEWAKLCFLSRNLVALRRISQLFIAQISRAQMPLPLIIAHRAAHSLMRNAAAEGSGPPSYLSRNLVALQRIYQLCHGKKLSAHPKKIVPFSSKTTFEMSKITFEVFQNISNIILAFVRGLFFRWLWVTTSLYKNSPGSTACEDLRSVLRAPIESGLSAAYPRSLWMRASKWSTASSSGMLRSTHSLPR